MVKEFFVSRFDRWNDRYRDEAIEPVLNIFTLAPSPRWGEGRVRG